MGILCGGGTHLSSLLEVDHQYVRTLKTINSAHSGRSVTTLLRFGDMSTGHNSITL